MSSNKMKDANEDTKNDGFEIINGDNVAQWMREKDWVFDFRGADLWKKDGGVDSSDYDTNLFK